MVDEAKWWRQADAGKRKGRQKSRYLCDSIAKGGISESSRAASNLPLGQTPLGSARKLQTKGNVITRTQAYQVGDKTFATLEEAQTYEMQSLLNNCSVSGSVGSAEFWKSTAEFVVEQKDKVVDILTTGPRSKPKARKINKKNKPKEAAA